MASVKSAANEIEKCRRCRFFRIYRTTMTASGERRYCRAPWWHPKRWTCKLPKGVKRS